MEKFKSPTSGRQVTYVRGSYNNGQAVTEGQEKVISDNVLHRAVNYKRGTYHKAGRILLTDVCKKLGIEYFVFKCNGECYGKLQS